MKDIDRRVLARLGLSEIQESGEPVATREGARCGLCGDAFEGPVLACPHCRAPHHPECWEYNEGCTIYGCAGALAAALDAELAMPEVGAGAPSPARLGERAGLPPLARLAAVPPAGWHSLGAALFAVSLPCWLVGALGRWGRPLFLGGLVAGVLLMVLGTAVQESLVWWQERRGPRRLISVGETSTKDLEARLARDPKDLEALSALALIHFARQDWKRAHELYLEALGLAPEEPPLLFRYARTLDRLERRDEAQAVFLRLATDHRTHPFGRSAQRWLEVLDRRRPG